MGFYSSYHKGEDDKDQLVLSPKEKAEFVTHLHKECLSQSPSLLFDVIEFHNALPDLLQKAAEINDEKSKYILNLCNLMSQLEQLVATDDGEKFSHFLADNSEFVVAFPPVELFHLLCWWGCSALCVKALLESSLAVHVDVNRFASYRCSTPLEAAATYLCPPLTRTLLQFGADVHYTLPTMGTPLSTAMTSLRCHKLLNLKQTTKQDITDLFDKLSSKDLREAVDTIYLLASAACSDFERMLKPIVFESDGLKLALLLVIALPLIMCPPSDGPWSMDNTPVARVLSSLPCPDLRKKEEAWTVFQSVWEASQNLCKLFFVLKLTPGVKEEFPVVMRGYFQQYINAHLLDVHTPSKRAVVPQGVTPVKESEFEVVSRTATPGPKRHPMARSGLGMKGQKIQLLTNHFLVKMPNSDGHFYQYSVKMTYEDGTPVEAKGIGRKVLDKLDETYQSELAGKQFAYDGEKTLFTLGSLPLKKDEYKVVLEEQQATRAGEREGSPAEGEDSNADKKRPRRSQRSKTYKVEITYATKIPLQAITNALRGQDTDHFQEAVRVLDIILRQHAARQGCLLVRQSFFHNEPRNFTDVGGGVLGCRGFHSSFRATQGGLSLNIDVSTTMIVQPGPVIDFLLRNQSVQNPMHLDWAKVKKTLKNLRITARPSNVEFKITGLSDNICREQMFELKQRNANGESQSVEISVYEYFVQHHGINLQYSGDFPCINVGKPKKPSYFPIELCDLVSLQRYTKSLSGLQRASLVEKSRQKPQERMKVLTDALRTSNYGADPLLKSSGIIISNQFARVDGRVLQAPQLTVGKGEIFNPRNGQWNFNSKELFQSTDALQKWIIVNFCAQVDMNMLTRDIVKCGQRKGIKMSDPFKVFNESPQHRTLPASARVEKIMDAVKSGLPGPPQFILCILPEKKNCDVYGPWKRTNLADLGIVTQCIAPQRLNDQYLTNVLLKINAKLGGLNSVLTIEHAMNVPLVSKIPTVIVGMDVSHGSPGRADVPSIAAVVASRGWPSISRYRASVRTQSPKVEMIDGLFKPVPETNQDDGMIRELLVDFFQSSGKRKPGHIIIFRDGVSESQFSQVLNIELDQIKEACKFLEEHWSPKFTLIVAQKNHHTKFFQDSSPDNVPPGTVVDNSICHQKNYDFYMCSHAGMIGTTRPTHYHVLLDEIGFSAGDLQDLVHSLSYVNQRSTTATSVVAPICYAHLAASQVGQFMKFDDFSETSLSQGGGVTSAGSVQVPQLPRLHPNVCSSMFFC